MKQRNNSFLKEYGYKLLGKGYSIVPIKAGYKYPAMHGWQNIKADKAQLEKWLTNGYSFGGVGVKSKRTPGIDLDVYDQEILEKLVDWCENNIGPTVKRVGEAPKTLLVYRTETPFKKLTSRKYQDFVGRQHKVEILGDGQQFVAFAIHPGTNKPYRWVSEKTLADLPQEKLPLITLEQAQALISYFHSIAPDDWEVIEKEEARNAGDYTLSGSDRMLLYTKPKLDISSDDLKKAVNTLDPNMGRLPWVTVGMGLFHQFEGSAEGFQIWNDWSAKGDTYTPSEMEKSWASFMEDFKKEPVTAASIIYKAKQAYKEKHGPVRVFLDRYIYVQDGDLICDLKKPPYCSISEIKEFKNRTANVRHEITTSANQNKTKFDAVWKAWLVHPERRAAEGMVYRPGSGRVITDDYGLDWINEFYMPDFVDTKDRDKLKVFFEHMDYLFPEPKEREWFIDWMAFNLQFPGRRCKVTPLHISIEHGVGRGWVVELMGKLLGQWNCTKTKMSTLSGKGNSGSFQDYLNKSLFCAIEEVREGNKRYQVSDEIRDLLSEPSLEVNLKYGSKKTQQVFTNFFFMSNHPDALVLTEEDRRINVLSGPEQYRNRAYYGRLYAWLDTEGVRQLHAYLMARDLTKFNWVRSMQTGACDRMIGNNRTETETLFWDLMEAPPYPVMTVNQIATELNKQLDGDEFSNYVDESQLIKLLQHHAKGPFRIKIDKKARRVWQLNKGKTLSNDEIKEEISKCGL